MSNREDPGLTVEARVPWHETVFHRVVIRRSVTRWQAYGSSAFFRATATFLGVHKERGELESVKSWLGFPFSRKTVDFSKIRLVKTVVLGQECISYTGLNPKQAADDLRELLSECQGNASKHVGRGDLAASSQ